MDPQKKMRVGTVYNGELDIYRRFIKNNLVGNNADNTKMIKLK